MHFSRLYTTVDTHTAGEPLRVLDFSKPLRRAAASRASTGSM